MSDDSTGVGAAVGIFSAVVGLSMVAVLVSQKSQTAQVLQALATGGSSLIGAAVSPVTGASSSNSSSSSSGLGSGYGVQAP